MLLKEKETSAFPSQAPHPRPRQSRSTSPLPSQQRELVLKHIWWGFGIIFASLLLGTLLSLKNEFKQESLKGMGSFRWYVMMEGDQVQIDEIGKYLKQLDGVSSITFTAPQDMVKRLQEGGKNADYLDHLDLSYFPWTWEIEWQTSFSFTHDELNILYDEIKHMPSVLDVSYDLKSWNSIKKNEVYWTQLRVILSLIALLGILFSVVAVGYTFFFTEVRPLPLKNVLVTLAVDTLLWLCGYLVINQILVPLPPVYLLGGLIMGFFHLLWKIQDGKMVGAEK